ncbi:MAG: hypothetical protein U1F36_10710 [Planctomycetota bacterium]
MLKIRPEQYEVLAKAQLERFLADAERHVRQYWPAVAAELGDAGVRAMVEQASRRCDELGIDDEFDVLRYLNLTCALGPDFLATQPWAAPLLGDRERAPRDRMDEATRRALGATERNA